MTNTIEIENLNISDLDIPKDETLQEVATACENIATSSEEIATSCGDLAKDSTLQSVKGSIDSVATAEDTLNNTLGTVAKDATLQATNTALGSIMTDATGQDIKDSLDALALAVKPNANNIPYSNTSSGLIATEVQSAIDEICTDLILTKTYTASYTAGGNASTSITADDFNVSTPSGYTPIGISDFASQNVNVTIRGIYGRASGTSTMMALRNISSTSVTATAYVTILYIKSLFT